MINRHIDSYARQIWFTDYWIPGVTLKTTVNIQSLADILENKGVSLNAALIKSLAQALSEFPKLNYYTFWGKLVWAGENTKISVITEERKFEECGSAIILDAEKKKLEDIHHNLEISVQTIRSAPQDRSFIVKLMNRFPRIAYYMKRFSGQLVNEYISNVGPIILSNLNIKGVEEMYLCGAFFTMLVCPGQITNNNMPLLLTFNHQLANARPIGSFLARVKEILEDPDFF